MISIRGSSFLVAVGALLLGCHPVVPLAPDAKAELGGAKQAVAESPPPAAPIPPVDVAPATKAVPAPQLTLETSPASSVLQAGKPGELFVRVRLTGLALASAKRPPINLVLVVDTSGSMEGAAMDREREACATLVDSLGEGDALSVVTFGSEVHVIVPATRTTNEKKTLAKEAIRSIQAEGTTDMAGGLTAGIREAQTFLSTDGINRIVLVGDGVPNDPAAVNPLVDQATALHVPITTLGLGPDFDETLMTSVAKRSGGTFHFVDDASGVADVFKKELSKMERLVARGTWVELDAGPGVVIEDVIGLEHGALARGVRLQIGDLSEGQVRDAIVKVSVVGHHDGTKVELFDAVAHYNVPATESELTARKFIGVSASSDAKRVTDSGDADVQHEVARVRVADDIVRAMALARAGDLKGARALLDATAKLATAEGKRFEDAELSKKSKEALSVKKTLASLAPLPPVVGPGFGPRMKMPSPMEATPAAALQMRSVHGDAMRELQGE